MCPPFLRKIIHRFNYLHEATLSLVLEGNAGGDRGNGSGRGKGGYKEDEQSKEEEREGQGTNGKVKA